MTGVCKPALIGQVMDGRSPRPFLPISATQLASDTAWATTYLRTLGVRPASVVVLLATNALAGHVVPLEQAARGANAAYMCIEPRQFTAERMDFVSRFPVSAVLGSAEALAAVSGATGADPLRHAGTDAPGVPAYRWLPIGPTMAVECARGGFLHISPTWSMTSDEGYLVATETEAGRSLRRTFRSDVRAALTDEACPCGLAGPRILPVSWTVNR